MPLSSKLRAEYVELINQALDTIPMLKPADFGTVVRDLEKILASMSGGDTPNFDPDFKENMEGVYEFYTMPKESVGLASDTDYSEYQQIIKDRIQAKITELTSYTPKQQHEYVRNQQRLREQATKDQERMVKAEPNRANHERQMEALRREEHERAVHEQRIISFITAVLLLGSMLQRPIITHDMPQARYIEEAGRILLGAGLSGDYLTSSLGLDTAFSNISPDAAQFRLQFLRNFSDIAVCLIKDHNQNINQVFRICFTDNSRDERLSILRDAISRNDQAAIAQYIQTWNRTPLEAEMLDEISSAQATRNRLFQPETYANHANRILLNAGLASDLLITANSINIFGGGNTAETAETKLEALRNFADIAVTLIQEHDQNVERVFNICFDCTNWPTFVNDDNVVALRNAIRENDRTTIAQYIQRWGPVSFVD